MKNITKILSVLLVTISLVSCDDDPDNVIYDVLDFEKGAVLRTIEVQNAILNSSVPESEFSVVIEAQDEEDGGLLESVDVFVSIRDLTPANGTTTVNDAFVKSIPASEFSVGPVGLPRNTIKMTFAEARQAMGLSSDDYAPGDLFIVELRINLTDGRTFGAADAGGIITGGFFSSPYRYNVLLTCSPQPGDYTVEMFDSYGDGWQTNTGSGGDGIKVNIDGTIVQVGLCSPYGGAAGTFLGGSNCTPNDGYSGTATVTIPEGTESATWNFPGDNYGEIAFAVYGPDGQLLYEVATGEASPGLLPITLCAE